MNEIVLVVQEVPEVLKVLVPRVLVLKVLVPKVLGACPREQPQTGR